MNRLRTAALCLLLAAGCSDPAPAENGGEPAAGADITFVSGVRLIPGDGGEPIEDAAMVVENGIITKVGKKGEVTAPKGSVRVDFEGATIMPLFVNLQALPGLRKAGTFDASNYNRDSLMADIHRYGYYGVGAVLSFGTDSEDLALKVRDEQRSAKPTVARLFTSGRGLTGRGGWPGADLNGMPMYVTGEADARKAVTELADKKVDAITMWVNDNLKPEAYRAAIDEAHKRNLKIFADAPSLAHAKDLVKSGIDGLAGSVRNQEVDAEFIGLMKEKNIPLAPALSSLQAGFIYADSPDWLGEQTMREVYPGALAGYLADAVTVNRFKRRPETAQYRQQYSVAAKNLKKLAEGGVKIAFGTGSGSADTFPGYFEHRELELMVEAGLSPADAIKTISVSADALGAKDLGALVANRRGDFMVLSNNPLEKITNSKDINKVYVSGQNVDQLSLIQGIKTEAPKITPADRAKEAEIQRQEAEAAAEAKLRHYGPFVDSGSAVTVDAGVLVQKPKRSNATVTKGPPHRVVVTLAGAKGEDLRAFYADILPTSRWAAAGNCWEKRHPTKEKTLRLCADPSAGQIVLNITEQ